MFGITAVASATENTQSTNSVSCIKEAVIDREITLQEGWGDFSGKVASAYTERKSALEEAYSNSDVKEIKSTVKSAWSEFKSSVKKARADWKKDRKDAWAEFKTDRKACRSGNTIVDDTSNQSADVQ
jgi:hypothetical protein